MKKIVSLFFCLAFAGVAASAQQQAVTEPNYELAAQFTAKKVSQMVYSLKVDPKWFHQSDRFWYEWKTADGTKYYIVDPVTGAKKEAFDMEKLAMQLTEAVKDPFDAKHIPFSKLKLSQDDKCFTFDIKSTEKVEKKDAKKDAGKEGSKGDKKPKKENKVFHFEYDIASGTLKDVTEDGDKKAFPSWAKVSPDGSKAVYRKNRNLYWMTMEDVRKLQQDKTDSTVVEHQITTDATEDLYYGSSSSSKDTAARMSASIAWSPDSKHFAVIKYDASMLKDFWVINSVAQPRPTLETYHYQMPGEPGTLRHLLIYDAVDFSFREVDITAFKEQTLTVYRKPELNRQADDEYHVSQWLGDNEKFYLERTSRDIKRVDLCQVFVNDTIVKPVVEERLNTYVETREPILVDGGREFIWWSERNGWANLYLYAADGTLKRNLTEGAYHVEQILSVDEKTRTVFFLAMGVDKDENPYNGHVYSVNLDGKGGIKRLDDANYNSTTTSFSDDGKYFVNSFSRVDCAPQVALFDASGRKTALEEADFSRLLAAGYRFPEPFKVKAADGITDLYGYMYKPFDFDSTKTYPILDYVYPGPQVEGNDEAWSKGFLRKDRLAQIGFIVVTVGNRGGHPNRSKWYHNYGYGNLRDYGLEDQKYAIQQLAGRYGFIDINRVGIHGHSGGGFMSTAAILKYPDFFKVAVSCSGNHDNSIYNRWWSEQHHGILEEVSAKGDTTFTYSIDKNQSIAKNLKGHLMLVTGDIDNNVNPANTIRVVDALIRANKRFDLLILPGQRHAYGDMNEYFFWRMADYYSEWLLGSSQRNRVDITQMNND